MNKVERLISQLCPEGVPMYALGAIGTTVSGLRGKSKEDFSDGNAPYVSYVEIFNNPGINFVPEKRVKVDSGEMQSAIQLGDVLVTGSSETRNECGMTAVVTSQPEVPIYVNSFCFIWRPNSGVELDPQFMKHLFRGRGFRDRVIETANGVTRQNISKPKFLAIEIPVPPLAVQREVALILNKFAELEAALQAELEARKSQYDHYRRQLLECEGKDFTEVELGSFGRVLMCKRIMKEETASFGDVPFYKIGTFGGKPDAFITQAKFDEFRTKYPFPKSGSLLISAAGTIGKIVKYVGEPSYFQDSNIVWLEHDESVVLNDYLFHCYKIAKWSTDTGSIPRLYNSNILKLKIKVPSLDEQRKVANFLGLFETLTNDEFSGIPAEISSRQSQYEFYRSKLLTFKELEVT